MIKQVRGRLPHLLLLMAAVTVLFCAGCTSQPSPTTPALSGPPDSFLASVNSMAALGDSITQGVNACGKVAACPAVSWATGSDQTVNSLAQRIGHINGSAPKVFNDARAGAKASGLSDQVDAALKQHPDLVTILVGSNDVCRGSVSAMTPVADFSQQISSTLDRLTQGLPEAYIFVASLPNLGQLVAATQSIPAASALWAKGKLCGSLTNASSDSDGGSQRFAQVAAQITGYNEQIDDLCSQFARCIYDGGAVTSEKFDAADISDVDYFHPSTAGQQLLAATTWQSLETGAACIATQSSSC